MEWLIANWWWPLIGLVVLVVILLIIIEAMIRKNKKRRKVQAITGVVETKDVRLSKETNQFDKEGNVQATLAHQDIICKKGQTMTAGKNADLKPGKYTLLTAAEGQDAFNVRIGGFVREYKHGSVVMLGEGESICPTSGPIILR